jgi:hypothetical protein
VYFSKISRQPQVIRMIGSGKTALIGSLGPVTTLYLAHVFLGESLHSISLIRWMRPHIFAWQISLWW